MSSLRAAEVCAPKTVYIKHAGSAQIRRIKLFDHGKLRLAFGRMLIYGDGKIAAYGVGAHDGHHVHGAALAPEFNRLGERSGIDFPVAEHLAAEADYESVFFIQASEGPLVSHGVDQL